MAIKEPYRAIYNNLYSENSRQAILIWWKELEARKGERSELRRADSPIAAAMCKATYRLQNVLPYWNHEPEILAIVAGILSTVTSSLSTIESFPMQMASKNGEKPCVSESRFQKIIKSHDLPELYLQTRRAVKLIEGPINILSLADGIISFSEIILGKEIPSSKKSVTYQWANDYYSKLL